MKQRLVGAVVLVALAVVFLPMILDGSGSAGQQSLRRDIPKQPEINSGLSLPALEKAQPSEKLTQWVGDELRPYAPEDNDDEPELSAPEPVPSAEVQPEPPVAEEPRSLKQEPVAEALTAYVVQVGSFSRLDSAEALEKRLRDAGYPAFTRKAEANQKTVYRVLVGPEVTRALAEVMKAKLEKQENLSGLVKPHYGSS